MRLLGYLRSISMSFVVGECGLAELTNNAVTALVSQEPAACGTCHCAHEASLALLWVVRVARVLGVAIGI